MMRWALSKTVCKVEREWNDNASLRRDLIERSPRVASMVSKASLLLAAALIGGFGLAASAAAQASEQSPAVAPYILTPERIAASMAAVVALMGAVVGGLALARSSGHIGNGNGRRWAIVALVLGPIALVIGGLVVVTADGGVGTGNGLAGGVVAVMVGLIGMALGGLALSRSRRTV